MGETRHDLSGLQIQDEFQTFDNAECSNLSSKNEQLPKEDRGDELVSMQARSDYNPEAAEGSQSRPPVGRTGVNFEFINITTNPEIERKTWANRQKVRSKAMFFATQKRTKTEDTTPMTTVGKKRVPRSKALANTRQRGSGVNVPNLESSDTSDKRIETRAVSTAAPSSFAAVAIDPFDTRPHSIDPEILPLLRFYLSVMSNRSSSYFSMFGLEDLERHILPLQVSSAAVYNSVNLLTTMQYYKLNKNLLKNMCAPLECERKAIAAIQSDIQLQTLPSDELIFATAMLGGTEVFHGDAVRGKIHLKGLAQMVKMRGGIEGITSQLVRNMVSWIWTLGIIDQGYLLRLGLARFSQASEPYAEPPLFKPSPSIHTENHIFLFLENTGILDYDIAMALQHLRDSLVIDSDYPNGDIPLIGLLSTKDLLIRYIDSHESMKWNIKKALCIAALLYIEMELQGSPGDEGNNLAVKLSQEMQEQIQGMFHSDYSCLMLWILYCGAAFSPSGIRSWYVSEIKTVAGVAARSWEETKAILSLYIWSKTIDELPYRKFYLESL